MPRNKAALFTSNSTEWATPETFVRGLEKTFGYKYYLDVAATARNTVAPWYFDRSVNCLTTPWWKGTRGKRRPVWMNPPYGDREEACPKNCKKKICVTRGHHIRKAIPGISDFVYRALAQVNLYDLEVDILVPARTDTGWFQDAASQASEVLFVRGRLHFRLPGTKATASAPFPSAVIRLQPSQHNCPAIYGLIDREGKRIY